MGGVTWSGPGSVYACINDHRATVSDTRAARTSKGTVMEKGRSRSWPDVACRSRVVLVGCGYVAVNVHAGAWDGVDAEGAAYGDEPVLHVGEPVSGAERGRVAARAGVANVEGQAVVIGEADRDARRAACVLGGVLERLEAAEVHALLGLRRVSAQFARLHGGRCGRTSRRVLERLHEPAADEHGRVDAVGKFA